MVAIVMAETSKLYDSPSRQVHCIGPNGSHSTEGINCIKAMLDGKNQEQ
jgi:hypothetical protein